MPGWIIALLALTLQLPALVAVVDAFARARRRKEPVGPWFRWLGICLGPAAGGTAAGRAAGARRRHAGPASGSPAAGRLPARRGGAGRPRRHRRAGRCPHLGRALPARALASRSWPTARRPGAAVAVCLATCAATLVLWLLNPYASLVLIPAAHLLAPGHALGPGAAPPGPPAAGGPGSGARSPRCALLAPRTLDRPPQRGLVPAAARDRRLRRARRPCWWAAWSSPPWSWWSRLPAPARTSPRDRRTTGRRSTGRAPTRGRARSAAPKSALDPR